MAGTVSTLLKYKVLSFFGPAFRGRFGPAPYILLMLLFAFYGILVGFGLGTVLKTSNTEFILNLLGTIFSGAISFGFIFSLGTGTAAHASELDFVMTAPVKPRTWLLSDMLFLFTLMVLSGGAAGIVAATSLVLTLGVAVWLVLILLLLFSAFVLLLFMTVQILLILRIRHPKARIKTFTVVLLVLSLIPSLSLVSPTFPLAFSSLPIPQSGFAWLAYDILFEQMPSIEHLVYALGWLGLIAVLWYALSNDYIFYGIRPTVTAGFGQVDFASKMAQQRRITTSLGGLTTRVSLRTDTGTDLGFLTRFHLIRVWRDGSVLFVFLLIIISTAPSFLSSTSTTAPGATTGALQIMTLPIAILALYWSYYERENLWLVVTSGKSVVNYFRGMMLSFAALVMIVSSVLIVGLLYAAGFSIRVEDLALPVIAPILSSITATAMLTRVKIPPGGFSPMVLALILVTILVGDGGGFAMQTFVSATPASLGGVVKALEIVVVGALLLIGGEALIGRLAKGFRF